MLNEIKFHKPKDYLKDYLGLIIHTINGQGLF